MLEAEYSRVCCSPLSREVSPGAKQDIYNRPGNEYTRDSLCPEHASQCQKNCRGYTYRSLEATVELGEEWVVPR